MSVCLLYSSRGLPWGHTCQSRITTSFPQCASAMSGFSVCYISSRTSEPKVCLISHDLHMVLLTPPYKSRFIHVWKVYFFNMSMHWRSPSSYCILLVKKHFLQFVCALSTTNLLLHLTCERIFFCILYVLWAPLISYGILLVKNLFLQFECALSTANLLLHSSCEESFSAVRMCSEHRQSPYCIFTVKNLYLQYV